MIWNPWFFLLRVEVTSPHRETDKAETPSKTEFKHPGRHHVKDEGEVRLGVKF